MNKNNIIKILVIIIIVLSIGLLATTIKLTTMDKSISNQDTPIVADKNSGVIFEKLEDEIINEEPNESQDKPISETPIEEIKEDKDLSVDNNPPKQDELSKLEKPKNEKSDNENKLDKDKSNKDEKKNNKDNKNKDNKKDKNDKKDKSKEEKAIVNPKFISSDEATKIGLNKVGTGAKLIEIQSDLDDNPPKYELEIILGNYEYEIEIHAITGAVIDFEKNEK